jgi:hypothetical protein
MNRILNDTNKKSIKYGANNHSKCELEAALLETKRDIKEGKFIKEPVEKHKENNRRLK